MSFLIRDDSGNIQEVIECRSITREELAADVEQARVELTQAEEKLANYDNLASPAVEVPAPIEEPVPEVAAPENLTELPAPVVITPTVDAPVAPVAEPIQPTAIPIQ